PLPPRPARRARWPRPEGAAAGRWIRRAREAGAPGWSWGLPEIACSRPPVDAVGCIATLTGNLPTVNSLRLPGVGRPGPRRAPTTLRPRPAPRRTTPRTAPGP